LRLLLIFSKKRVQPMFNLNLSTHSFQLPSLQNYLKLLVKDFFDSKTVDLKLASHILYSNILKHFTKIIKLNKMWLSKVENLTNFSFKHSYIFIIFFKCFFRFRFFLYSQYIFKNGEIENKSFYVFRVVLLYELLFKIYVL
jgi:hypothetical protein